MRWWYRTLNVEWNDRSPTKKPSQSSKSSSFVAVLGDEEVRSTTEEEEHEAVRSWSLSRSTHVTLLGPSFSLAWGPTEANTEPNHANTTLIVGSFPPGALTCWIVVPNTGRWFGRKSPLQSTSFHPSGSVDSVEVVPAVRIVPPLEEQFFEK